MSGRDIDAIKVAILRQRSKLDTMEDEWSAAGGMCCPGCMFGDRWNTVQRKVDRQAAWLAILLKKRDWPGDSELAWRIGAGMWS